MDYTEMKDRIAHIIRAKNLTAAEFAIRLGIQPSNISHLLSGRNNPSLEFVKKLKETFPEYNLDWIVFGRGPMTISEPLAASTPVQNTPPPSQIVEHSNQFDEGTLFGKPMDVAPQMNLSSVSSNWAVKEIIIVYADDTFKRLMPR